MSSFEDKNMQAVPGRSPIGAKNINLPNRDVTRFSGKKENQLIPDINIFSDHLNDWIGKKLDFDVLKGLD